MSRELLLDFASLPNFISNKQVSEMCSCKFDLLCLHIGAPMVSYRIRNWYRPVTAGRCRTWDRSSDNGATQWKSWNHRIVGKWTITASFIRLRTPPILIYFASRLKLRLYVKPLSVNISSHFTFELRSASVADSVLAEWFFIILACPAPSERSYLVLNSS